MYAWVLQFTSYLKLSPLFRIMKTKYFLLTSLLLLSACASEQVKSAKQPHEHHQAQTQHQEKSLECTTPSTHCSDTVTAEFSPNGVLWAAWVANEHLYLQSSNDKGQTFSKPIMVNAKPEKIIGKGENRPKIKFDNKGHIYLSWALSTGKHHVGHIRFSHSMDGGKTFVKPVTINDDGKEIGHSFDSMVIGQQGEVFIAWLDSRDTAAAKAAGKVFDGSSVYYTVSKDGGKTFAKNQSLAAHVCQCCRLQTALAKDNTPVVMWRHIFEGSIRDHALIKFNDWQTPAEMHRVGEENWKIDACPHHGPGLAIADDIYHAVWFSNSDTKKGLFYANSQDNGQHFSAPVSFGGDGASHAHVQAIGQNVAIVWLEFDGKNNRVQLIKSKDAGKTWSKAETIATTSDKADNPFLINDDSMMYLSWQVPSQDYHLQRIDF
ncbi:hypothetical protein BAC3_01329 [uncultured bacterium]|nr:hypothetical protein BAC3_01329 [uncultured bacterium]